MTGFTFDVALFREQFPAFSDEALFPDDTLQMYWDSATCIIENDNISTNALSGACLFRALNLMTAHLAQLSVVIASGQTPGLVQSATIDKVTVSLTPPPLKSQFEWWLNLTAYGQQLFALLQTVSVGGFYFGGLPESAAFRKVGGVF